MVGWHHGLDGCESEWTLGDSDGQGGLVCCDSWGRNELDTTEWLNWTELNWTDIASIYYVIHLKPKNISMSYLFFHMCKQEACITCFFFFATGVSGIGISFHDSYLRILYCFLYHYFLEDRERNYTRKRNNSRIIKAEHFGWSTEWVSHSIMEVQLLLTIGDLFVSWVLHSLILGGCK